jgi:hypothetical protein
MFTTWILDIGDESVVEALWGSVDSLDYTSELLTNGSAPVPVTEE